jgi:hypothetical protein
MPKSYKRKNIRNKTNKKYYKVGGVEPATATTTNSTSKISEFEARITDLEMNMPVCIGIKSGEIPIWVKRDITVAQFWAFIHAARDIDLDALCLLPNVRGLSFERCRHIHWKNYEDQKLFQKENIAKLNERCPGLIVA